MIISGKKIWKKVLFSSNINSGYKISLSEPALSLPGTYIGFQGPAILLLGSALLHRQHFHFQDLHWHFRTCIIASTPALFYRNLSVKRNKKNRRKLTLSVQSLRRPFWFGKFSFLSGPSLAFSMTGIFIASATCNHHPPT